MLALYPNMLSSPQLNDVRHLNKVAVMQLRREPLRPLTFELGQNSGVDASDRDLILRDQDFDLRTDPLVHFKRLL